MKILLIEDDNRTADYVMSGLRQAGHAVDHVADGREGLIQATAAEYDVAIIDRMLPGLDGLSLVKTLRGVKNFLPVLFLSTLGGIDDRVEGLNAGGDDYLVKPFSFAELEARINALARRPAIDDFDTKLRVQSLELDLVRRTVTRQGQTIRLKPREFQLLEYLVRNRGRVVTRTMLLDNVWDIHFDPKTNVVETHISRLRDKMDKPFDTPLIKTVRGAGYCIDG